MISFKINKNDAGQRLDKFITKAMPGVPFSLVCKLVRKKVIKVNGKKTQLSYFLCENDEVVIYADITSETRSSRDLASLRIEDFFKPVYEDDDIMVVYKYPGILCHTGDGDDRTTVTLIDAITEYLRRSGKYNPERESSFSPAIANRIDRNTAGLVLAAKTAESLRDLNFIIKNRLIEKRYCCIVHSCPPDRKGQLENWLVKDEKSKTVNCYDKKISPQAKFAALEYNVLETRGEYSLLDVTLITGRTHQIRVQFSHIGCPLLGEGKYAVNRSDREKGYAYQALCCYSVAFSDLSQTSISRLSGKRISIDLSDVDFYRDFETII